MVKTVLYVVQNKWGLSRLQPGDTALAIREAARLQAPDGVFIYRDQEDTNQIIVSGTCISSEKIIELLFQFQTIVTL